MPLSYSENFPPFSALLYFGTVERPPSKQVRLSPGSLEENLFLYVNKRFWDITVVDKIITRG